MVVVDARCATCPHGFGKALIKAELVCFDSGVLEHGSCGFTNGDGSLVYPKEVS
jgi:hypothetical protein